MTRRQLLTVTLLVEGALFVLALLLRAALDLGADAPLRVDGASIAWGIVATLPLVLFVWWSTRTTWPPMRRLSERVFQIVRTLFAAAKLVDVAVVALLAGLCEELLFRGVVQVLLTRFWGATIGLVGASLVFALTHLITPMYAAVVFGMGMYLGTLLLIFDDLLVPIVVHVLYDFVALGYLMRVERRDGAANENAVPPA